MKGGGSELVTNSRDSFPAGTPRNVIVILGGRCEASATEGQHEDVVNYRDATRTSYDVLSQVTVHITIQIIIHITIHIISYFPIPTYLRYCLIPRSPVSSQHISARQSSRRRFCT